MKKKNGLFLGMLAIMLVFTAPVAVYAQDFTNGTILAQAQSTITRSYTYDFPAGASAVARQQIVATATARFERENPGYSVRNVETSNGIRTLTVTITGRRS
jgi:ABC-type glycerol-3-phosphate transport system substrate-binding protein